MEGTAADADPQEARDSGAPTTPLTGGHLLSAISTAIVKLMREHYGRGPIKAKT